MKNKIILSIILGSISSGINSVHAAEPTPVEIGIHIVEDVSGPEVQANGIRPADFEDMPALGDTIFIAKTTGIIGYDVIDENGGDNKPLQFTVTPFTKDVPRPPSDFRSLTVREKTLALKDFEQKKNAFLKDNTEWRSKVLEGAKSWFDDCVTHRIDVEEDFMKRLQANHNRDFRRSDVIGSIQKANELLSVAEKRFLILNSDMDHKPGPDAKAGEVRALNHADLSQDVVVIMVNTTRKPDQSPLLKDLPNKVLHADSLKQAAVLISAQLSNP